MNAQDRDAFALGGEPSDIAILAAEQKLLPLFARIKELNATDADEETVINPLFIRVNQLDEFIAATEPVSLAGAAVKLRRLLDPEIGMATGDKDSDVPALQQVLALIERVVARGAAFVPEIAPLSAPIVSAAPMAAVAEPGGLDALLMTWVALFEDCEADGKSDEERARLCYQMDTVARQILAGNPTTESDWRAVAAMAVISAREGTSYRNTDVLLDLYLRLVADRMTDPICRRRAQDNSRRQVERAKAHLAELGLSDEDESGGDVA